MAELQTVLLQSSCMTQGIICCAQASAMQLCTASRAVFHEKRMSDCAASKAHVQHLCFCKKAIADSSLLKPAIKEARSV